MRAITLTEKNIKSVYGRIRKFFYNNHLTGFECWHNFDCGFKKHISPIIYTGEGKKINVKREYPSPKYIEYRRKGTVPYFNYSYISLMLTATSGDSLRVGDKIAFCGNRIIYRTKFFCGNHKYIYTVFQVLPMEESKQYQIKIQAERRKEKYKIGYYKD